MSMAHNIKALLALCALYMPCITCHSAFNCDFGYPHELLRRNALASCHMDIDNIGSATVMCPNRVNDTDYVWHPEPTSLEMTYLKTYVNENGKVRSVALSDVVRSESGHTLFWTESNQRETELHLDLSGHKLFAITERRFIFICGPQNLVLSDALQRHLDRLYELDQMQSLPWTAGTPVTQEIAKIGKGLGLFLVNRGRIHLPLQGCGSRASPLFAPDNEVTVDPITGIRSCVVNPMSERRIGFVCEGRIEPDHCMELLLDKNGRVVKPPVPHGYWKFHKHRPWVVAKYFYKFALPPFNGECWCIDSETSQVNARIEIRSKTDYVCDITSNIFRNKVRPIRGPWCSVVLHPGSTLTIKFPIQATNPASIGQPSDDIDRGSSPARLSQLASIYEYETDFSPKDLTVLRQIMAHYDVDIYDDILYRHAIAGDALELDASKISRGEVKLKYHESKPLALKIGQNSFLYHWTLISRNEYVPDKIRAIVQVSFAFTHNYRTIGCDQGMPIVFDPEMTKDSCSTKWMGNGIGGIFQCVYDMMRDVRQVGIRCRPNEELLPDNCGSTGYDLSSNEIMPLPISFRNVTPYRIPGFRVFRMGLHNRPLSFACICVDEHGYETSRLILEYNHPEYHSYTVRRKRVSHTSFPSILLPGRDIGLAINGLTSQTTFMLNGISQQSAILHVGTKLLLYCGIGSAAYVQHQLRIHGPQSYMLATTWLPKQPGEFFYSVNATPDGLKLVKAAYDDLIATTPGGIRVSYQEFEGTPGYQALMIKSNHGAILISKDSVHRQQVPMTFVCGKEIEPSDLSIISGDASTTEASALPNFQTIRSSTQYTWHVVEVNVETTDPYMQGCGVTYSSDELFKPETPPLYDANGQPQFGCKIDIQDAKEAAFYCPAPYLLDPPNCFSQVSVDGEVRNLSDLSKSLVSSHSNHFVILSFDGSLVGVGETLRQTPPLECRCVTVKGIVLSSIQIENYYAK
ncbi:hypothetical protein, conserved [Babesia ovata]|uniref:6-Cys domain-containing protein n=1 Tax=Babesia ovata TaxID=189622 RepID=A0A2H6KAS5_9APIC|nr:uncharacterized protein BOVATA_015830 [Babesia ovata]GBE60090.1 hypothetical protein, conserved [Babesia ovata]